MNLCNQHGSNKSYNSINAVGGDDKVKLLAGRNVNIDFEKSLLPLLTW